MPQMGTLNQGIGGGSRGSYQDDRSGFRKTIDSIAGGIWGGVEGFGNWLGDMASGLWDIVSGIATLDFKKAFGGLWDTATTTFGLGGYVARGVAEGAGIENKTTLDIIELVGGLATGGTVIKGVAAGIDKLPKIIGSLSGGDKASKGAKIIDKSQDATKITPKSTPSPSAPSAPTKPPSMPGAGGIEGGSKVIKPTNAPPVGSAKAPSSPKDSPVSRSTKDNGASALGGAGAVERSTTRGGSGGAGSSSTAAKLERGADRIDDIGTVASMFGGSGGVSSPMAGMSGGAGSSTTKLKERSMSSMISSSSSSSSATTHEINNSSVNTLQSWSSAIGGRAKPQKIQKTPMSIKVNRPNNLK